MKRRTVIFPLAQAASAVCQSCSVYTYRSDWELSEPTLEAEFERGRPRSASKPPAFDGAGGAHPMTKDGRSFRPSCTANLSCRRARVSCSDAPRAMRSSTMLSDKTAFKVTVSVTVGL